MFQRKNTAPGKDVINDLLDQLKDIQVDDNQKLKKFISQFATLFISKVNKKTNRLDCELREDVKDRLISCGITRDQFNKFEEILSTSEAQIKLSDYNIQKSSISQFYSLQYDCCKRNEPI